MNALMIVTSVMQMLYVQTRLVVSPVNVGRDMMELVMD